MGQPINVQQQILDSAYSNKAAEKYLKETWDTQDEIKDTQKLVAEIKQEVKQPDFVDKAYVYYRSILPDWIVFLSMPVGALMIVITGLVLKERIKQFVDTIISFLKWTKVHK